MPPRLLERSLRHSIATAIALASLEGMLAGCVTNTSLAVAQSATSAAPVRTVVVEHHAPPIFVAVSGKRVRLASMNSLNPDCTLEGYMTVRVVVPPAHGRATVGQGQFYPTYPRANVRSACNSKPAEGVAAWYQSLPGYVGPDIVELEVIQTDGGAGRLAFHIDVR